MNLQLKEPETALFPLHKLQRLQLTAAHASKLHTLATDVLAPVPSFLLFLAAAPCCSVVNLRLKEPEAALIPLRKLHTLLPDQPEVVHCIALAHDMLGDTQVRCCCLPRVCVCIALIPER